MNHYSNEIAKTLARAAADAYRPKVEADTVRSRWSATDAEFIEDDDSTALLISDPASVVVAHRGTEITSLGDWRSDFDLRIGHTRCGKLKLSGHSGFLRAWQAVWPWLWLQVKDQKPAAVYVTGHSLGAPQAVLTALALHREGFNVRGCYTFGSPRCFTHGSARVVNRSLPNHYRITNGNDIVPRVPLPIRFRHAGHHMHLDRFGHEQHRPNWITLMLDRVLGYRGDLVGEHSMFSYRQALGGGK